MNIGINLTVEQYKNLKNLINELDVKEKEIKSINNELHKYDKSDIEKVVLIEEYKKAKAIIQILNEQIVICIKNFI